MNPQEEISALQRELDKTLRRAGRQRRILQAARICCYGATLVFFLFIVFNAVSMGKSPFFHDYEANPNPTFWEANRMLKVIIPLFILVYAGMYIPKAFRRFSELERSSIQKILQRLFPGIRYTLAQGPMNKSLLVDSHLFTSLLPEQNPSVSFSSLTLGDGNRTLKIYDAGIAGSRKQNLLAQTNAGSYLLIYRYLLKLMFTSRFESAMYTFRGMFAHATLAKALPGSVVVLPDQLEGRLPFLSQSIQALRTFDGNKLVKLEDPEFESFFSVYSTDEVLARYVLTPLKMRLITELRKKYGRDIMLSFHGNAFYFCVSMPEGLLTLGNRSVKNRPVIENLYDNIHIAQQLLDDLRLKTSTD